MLTWEERVGTPTPPSEEDPALILRADGGKGLRADGGKGGKVMEMIK